MDTSFGDLSSSAEDSSEAPLPRRFGKFELLQELGRGGMGVVYRARQLNLNREVALKILPGGEFARPDFRKRFRAEALTVAQLQHRNIVCIYDVGEEEGLPFFTMEFVGGRTLAEAILGEPLAPRQAAQYLFKLADAVQYAHDQGVVHRDLKPSNVLLDWQGEPRLTDFGLARSLIEASDLTITGQALGSPAYMAPEQVLGQSSGLSPAADIYSLGAVLYHLITGRPPFQADTIQAVLLQVREAEPIAPRRLNPSLPEDLQTICLKCLEKSPLRRYPTAQALADELERFLRDAPIQARPASPLEKIWRWCRVRPAIAALSASVLLLLIIVAVGSSVATWRIGVARRAETRERQKSELANFALRKANTRLGETVNLLELQRAEDRLRANDPAVGVAILAALLRRDPGESIAANRLVSALIHRNWIAPAARPLNHAKPVRKALFSPDGRQVLSLGAENQARVWDSVSGAALFLLDHTNRVWAGRYSADGRLIVTASADGTARVWNAANGEPLTAPLRHEGEVLWAEFNPDGQLVLTAAADSTAKVWESANGQLRYSLSGHESKVIQARFDSSGERIATATSNGRVRLWSSSSGALLFELTGHETSLHAINFSPDGRRFVAAGNVGKAWLWNLAEPQHPVTALVHSAEIFPIWHATFSPDSSLVLTTSEDTTAKLWDAVNGFPIGQPFRHEGGVVFGEFSPDGRLIVTTSADVSARVWDWRWNQPFGQPLRHHEPVRYAAFAGDGQKLVTASDDFTAQIWDLRERRVQPGEFLFTQSVSAAAFDRSGAVMLTTSLDRTARLLNQANGQPLGPVMQHGSPVLCGKLGPDGWRVVTGCGNGQAQVWDGRSGAITAGPVQHTGAVRQVELSPAGDRFLTASDDGTARVWDAQNGQAITPLMKHEREVLSIAFSPDGQMVATASADNTARIWDSRTGQLVTGPLMHKDHVRWIAFSPDGKRVITSSTDNTACIWDAKTGRRLTPPLQHARIVEMALFSPDGRLVVTGSQDRNAQIWDASTGQALTPPLHNDGTVSHVQFSPDGQRVLTGGWTGMIRLWDSNTGQPLTEGLFGGGATTSLGFDSTGSRFATGAQSGVLRLWDFPVAPTPVPAWLPAFAELVAGTHLTERGNFELVPAQDIKDWMRQSGLINGNGFYERLAQWFVLDPAMRPASPF